jgi:pimeloyl-ACP methyl ester carboxylesterase
VPLLTTPAGATIAWESFGDVGHPPLLLIQGLSAQMLAWHPGFCRLLADAGFHVVRFDNRDVGGSQRYPDGYELSELADDTAALVEGLGLGPVHVVGQSMGGMIAQYLATKHPDIVKSLGLLYTAANVAHLIGASGVVEALDVSPKTRDEFIAGYIVTEGNAASAAYEQDVAWLAELGGLMYDAGVDPLGVKRQVDAVLAYTDRTEDDRMIDVPTVILAGESDRLIDYHASLELHEIIPHSTVRIFPGMGHELPRALWPDLVEELSTNARRA